MFLLAGAVVAFGAFVQGGVGFGLALIATPLLALLDPSLVPAPLLLVTSVQAVLALVRERGDTDWPGVGWSLLGRLPGTALGVLAVVVLPVRAFLVLVALLVLVCVALSVSPLRPRRSVGALLVAGVVSGLGGTAASIGGPPLALLYRDEPGPRVRSTLAAYFTAGSVVSLAALGAAGRIDPPALTSAAKLLPFLLVGFALSGPARRVLDRGWANAAVLGLATAGALALMTVAVTG